MAARVTDWGLAVLIAALVASGGLTLFAGSTGDTWVFAAHDVLGIGILLLLGVKLRRVGARVFAPARWDRRTIYGVVGTALAVAALVSGLLWANGVTPDVAGYSLLSVHDALGVALLLGVAAHMVARAKPLRRRDLAHRRQFLAMGAMTGVSLVAWRTQRPLQVLLGLPGAKRRFTGSYEAASFGGNAFPTTSWVADSPRPVDLAAYRLRIEGLVGRRLAIALADLPLVDELVATLDCTGGFYSTQRWRGVRLSRILEPARPKQAAGHVSVASVTGYRWSFAMNVARELLLATRVGDEALSQEHGAPVRLVVPWARGFQWVKWVQRIDLLDHPDYGAPASTVWSSLTAVGSGGR
ncbi:MAG: molybdopterin-binding oxidoreductase [Actinobacteria bacterium]|nr:MAG: molybdopterin-binding oxidoreductase [Actinomycetota bacterium]